MEDARHSSKCRAAGSVSDVAVADPVDLVAEPAGGLGGVPVEREVPCTSTLSAANASGGRWSRTRPNSTSRSQCPEVAPGQLVGEDLAEGRPQVAQLVRAPDREREVEGALDPGHQVGEVPLLHGQVGGAPGTGASVSSNQSTSGLAAMLRTTSGKYDGRAPK